MFSAAVAKASDAAAEASQQAEAATAVANKQRQLKSLETMRQRVQSELEELNSRIDEDHIPQGITALRLDKFVYLEDCSTCHQSFCVQASVASHCC